MYSVLDPILAILIDTVASATPLKLFTRTNLIASEYYFEPNMVQQEAHDLDE